MEEKFIEVKQLYKTFHTKKKDIEVLKGIDLSVEKGEIYGIVGFSGAGKSTLVRCINRLEEPDSGSVKIGDKEITALGKAQLNAQRRKIGMIFQQFNLFDSMTVAQNIAYPLKLTGTSSREVDARVDEMLSLVGLTEKKNAYPGELSGGQKQRVGIARALANQPDVLLSDEATSALDPQTTKSILALLKEINQKYGITIVIITHEMAVVREICTRVGIIGNGELVEHGNVIDVFSHPQSDEAKELVLRNHGENYELVESLETKNCVRIVFSENSSYEPVIANMVLKFGLPVNILKADTKNVSGIAHGEMILGLPEDRAVADEMRDYLRDRNLAVEEVTGYVG